MSGTGGNRSWLTMVAGLFLAVLTVIPSALLAFFAAWSCGGNGGSPYVARASPWGQACETGLVNAWALVVLIAPPVVAIGGMIAYMVSRRKPFLLAAAAVPVIIFGLTIVLNYTLRSECTDAQWEAGEDCQEG